jgi:DNA-directed RNA polymerase subunit RPC12/RpoP
MTYRCPSCGQTIELYVAAETWCSACPDRPLMVEASPKELERE